MECPHELCRNSLRPWNAATNFTKPVFSVKHAVDADLINSSKTILEFGAGNLRNALYVQNIYPNIEYSVIEKQECMDRFTSNYDEFKRKGGRIIQNQLDELSYEILVCTFVLETICPSTQRINLLRTLTERLTRDGMLIASFRGYPGIQGSRYTQCPAKEGFITPKMTFVKGYSIPEVTLLLTQAGFTETETLQKYKVQSPQNIHISAKI